MPPTSDIADHAASYHARVAYGVRGASQEGNGKVITAATGKLDLGNPSRRAAPPVDDATLERAQAAVFQRTP
jgi:hypothetical protein